MSSPKTKTQETVPHYGLDSSTTAIVFYGGPMTWASAELCCRESVSCNGDTSAHLASIHNQDENDFVYDYWQTSLAVAGCDDTSPWQLSTKALWIGFGDNETEGKCLWAFLCATVCGCVCRGVWKGCM